TGNRDPARHTFEDLRTFLEAFDRGEQPQPKVLSPVLRLRGVPFQCELSDVVGFLAEYGMESSSVVMGRNAEGKKTGEAFATFESVELADTALEEKHKQEIQGRYIELFRASLEERDEAWENDRAFIGRLEADPRVADSKELLVTEVKQIQRASVEGRERWETFCDLLNTGNRDPTRHSAETLRAFADATRNSESLEDLVARVSSRCKVVRLRGVPFQCDPADVIDFLADFKIKAQDITFVKKEDGRATGEALVEFPSKELADQAVEEKHKKEIRGRYIELFRSNQGELNEAICFCLRLFFMILLVLLLFVVVFF
ncbi:unnamed protein product, partial [Polarella glacialis]